MDLSNYKIEFNKIINRDYFSKSLHPVRKEAFAQFEKIGFPTQKWEDWRFTNLSSISKGNYKISEVEDAPKNVPDIDKYKMTGIHTIVIYNGHYQKQLSSIPDGVKLLSGIEYFKGKGEKLTTINNSPFDLFNTAFTDSGISIIVEKNTNINMPIRILFISNGDRSIMVNPRINIDLHESSSLTFMEHHVGNAKSFFENKSVFINIGDHSFLNHITIKSNSEFTQNIENLNISQLSNSKYEHFQFIDGGKLGRNNIHIDLLKPNATCNINCLVLSKNKQHIDNNIIVNHNSSHTYSKQFVKSILFDSSSGVFNGRTIVNKDSQQITAHQNNKNLLLSKNANVNSNPQLEIYADNVKCTHGSTTGQIDEDTLFYLQSRGIDKKDALKLMVIGYGKEILDNISHDEIKKSIQYKFANKLNKLMNK